MNISSEIREATKLEALRLVNEKLAKRGIQSSNEVNQRSDEVFDDIEIGMSDDEEEDLVRDEIDSDDFLEEDDDIVEIDSKLEGMGKEILNSETKGYTESKPISSNDVDEVAKQSTQSYNTAQRVLHNNGYNQGFSSEEILRKIAQQKAEKEQVAKKEPDIFYTSGNFMIAGKQVKATRAIPTLNLDKYKENFREGDLEGNYRSLCHLITIEVLRNFPNAHTIAVCDNALIINGTCFQPNIQDNDVRFPLDSIQYIKNGCIAPFFDWSSCIKTYKRTLKVLSFDDSTFYTTYVADSIGVGRRIGVSTAFRIFPELEELYIGDESINREELNTPKSAEIKKKVATTKRFSNLYDGYQLNVCGATRSFQNFGINSLKNYATNRGNKGFIRYAFGTTARLGLATVGVATNFATHTVRAIGRLIKDVVKDSTTPIEDSDIYS